MFETIVLLFLLGKRGASIIDDFLTRIDTQIFTLATPRNHAELVLSFLLELIVLRGNKKHGKTNENTNNVQSTVEHDIDAMSQKSQPHNFSGEGHDVDKVLEEWIKRMNNHFDLAQPT